MALKAHLGPQAPRFGQIESRTEERRSLFLETSGALPGGLEANVLIHNISAAGLLLETELSLSAGDRLMLDLPDLGAIGVVIVWRSENLFGCAFETALSQSDLAAPQLQGASRPFAKASARQDSPISDIPNEPLGVRINRLRREKGLTLAQVASALSVSKPTVWAWEKGKARPLPDRIEPLAQALGVEPADLEERAGTAKHSAIVEDCRLRIATAYGTLVTNIRIMIEV